MKAVLIFDMDGVLADSWEVCYPCFQQFAASLNQPQLCSKEAILSLFEDNFMTSLGRVIPLTSLQSDLFLQLASDMNNALTKATCFAGIKPTLEILCKDHFLFLITANFTSAAHTFLKNQQLNCFQGISGADQSFNKAEKIRFIAKNNPGLPVYYIGDTLGDIIEGKAAGVKTVAAGWGWHDAATLRRGKPDYFLKHPEDLLSLINT
ncbi:HAD family hydrolase [Endozoicomonas atrinae]|uniref:HAD family hydrolase n=1 Tax=Endozoicomonas atrinae TaxID=1333660 RepID=UPI003AFF6A7A